VNSNGAFTAGLTLGNAVAAVLAGTNQFVADGAHLEALTVKLETLRIFALAGENGTRWIFEQGTGATLHGVIAKGRAVLGSDCGHLLYSLTAIESLAAFDCWSNNSSRFGDFVRIVAFLRSSRGRRQIEQCARCHADVTSRAVWVVVIVGRESWDRSSQEWTSNQGLSHTRCSLQCGWSEETIWSKRLRRGQIGERHGKIVLENAGRKAHERWRRNRGFIVVGILESGGKRGGNRWTVLLNNRRRRARVVLEQRRGFGGRSDSCRSSDGSSSSKNSKWSLVTFFALSGSFRLVEAIERLCTLLCHHGVRFFW